MANYIYPVSAPYPRALLGWDGTDFRVITIDATGHVQVDAVDLAGLQNALASVDADFLLVGAYGPGNVPGHLRIDAGGELEVTDDQVEGLRDCLVTRNMNAWIVAGTTAAFAPLELLLDAQRHLQVDVVASGLPAGAATAANQVTEITALQLIDDLRDALQSVNTDALQTRGEDQLFSYKDQIMLRIADLNAAAGLNDISSGAVPAGEVWVVTSVSAFNNTNACSSIALVTMKGATFYDLQRENTVAQGQGVDWQGHCYLVYQDFIRAYFWGCTAGDDLYLFVHGYKMTKET